ncbi:MAG: ZIP family metal transporter [Actinomycetota bacterium]|nr:ZIP family metal transporter [Actinomycetota bacterium]
MTTALLALTVIAVSLAAGLAPRRFADKLSVRWLEDLTGVASGLLLVSAILVVVPEGFHVAAGSAEPDAAFAFQPVILGLAILGGFSLMLILEGLGVGHAVHEEHHDHVAGHGHGHVHHPVSGSVMALGLSIHALADGLAIGAAAASGETSVSVLVTFGVLVHRVPAALSLGLFSLHQPGGEKAALRGLVLFALATPLSLVISYLALDSVDGSVLALVLLFSAGTFVYVATVDTLPAIHNPATGRRSVRNVVASAAVYSVILLLLRNAEVFEHTH